MQRNKKAQQSMNQRSAIKKNKLAKEMVNGDTVWFNADETLSIASALAFAFASIALASPVARLICASR